MRFAVGLSILLVSLVTSFAWSAEEEEAVVVFDRVSPSIVGIESVASSGTGILLDAKGTILTNAHVVALQLPLKCLIDVRKGTNYETHTFQKVQVIGIHPKLDLALIKVDPAENAGTLTPTAVNKVAPKTGQRVYAIGNPGARGRVKLTKTVTSGILSGGDRLIEGVSYLQFSAPINPGNSGGPLCDKTGKVIGLVTMKLPDLDNVGFAIPLQNITAAEFKPLKERPRDLAKASKLIDAGNEYIKQLNSVRRRRGGKDSSQAIILRMLALDSMHEALLLDPANGTIYMAIGDLFDEFEEFEVAEEYFRAGIAASPWAQDPRIFYIYRRHKMTTNKPAEAEAIWWKGIARHPHLAGSIWESLAIMYRDKQEYRKAATCAVVVSMLKNPGTRPDVANKIGEFSFNKLTDPAEQARTIEMINGMPEEMLRRIWQRKLLIGLKRPHVTKAFGEYLQRIDLKLDGSLTVERNPFVVASFEQRLTDIMATVDSVQLGLGAAWKKQEGSIRSSGKCICRLEGQGTIPDEYDLMISAERLSGSNEVVIGFVFQGEPAAVILDFGGSKSGFAGLKNPLYREAVFSKGEFVSLVIQVRKSKVAVRANETEILSVAVPEKLPAVPEIWRGPLASKMFIATQDSSLAVYAWQLVKLPTLVSPPAAPDHPRVASGVATPPSPGIPASPASVDPPGTAGGSTVTLPEIASLPKTGWGFQCLAFSPDGRFVAGGKPDEAVWIFDVDMNKNVGVHEKLSKLGQITQIAFTPDGKRLLTGGYKGIVQTWEFKGGDLTAGKQYIGHSTEIKLLTCSPDSKFVLSGDRDNRLRYWALETCREQQVWADFQSDVQALHIRSGGEFALATDSRSLLRLNLKTGESTKTKLSFGSRNADSAAFSPDGKLLALGDSNKVRLWQTEDESELPFIDTQVSEIIWSMAFTPSGKQLLTGASKTVAIWDLESRKRVNEAQVGPIGNVQTFAISADGKRLASIISMAGQPLKVFGTSAGKK